MSSLSTFGAFTTARLGIYSSSKWLDVIGNNISNINTQGYTRQAVDQISLHMGGADKYRTGLDVRVGNGGLVTGVSQLRDPYMDIRYRTEISNVGAQEAKLNGLGQIASILDEVAYGEDADGNLGNLELQFNDLLSQVSNLVNQGAGEDEFDTNVRTSASSLAHIFNSYASRLEKLQSNMEDGLKQDITRVNELLTNIRDLSDSIRKSNAFGGDALEQKDQRNNLIDELAEYIRIDVKYELEDMGGGLEVEKLVISLDGDDMDDPTYNKMVLVDGIYCAQLSIDHEVENQNAKTDADPPYLDVDGKPTDSKDKAARAFNEYYQVKVSTLRDRWSRTEDVPYEVGNKVMAQYMADNIADPAKVEDAKKKAEDAAKDLNKDSTKAGAIIGGKAYQFTYGPQPVYGKNDDDPPKDVIVGYEVARKASFTPFDLNDNTLYGALQAKRELLTEQGEYATKQQLAMDRKANIKRGVIYYQKALDTLANQFAHIMNDANRDPVTGDVKPLFSNHGSGDDFTRITAANISISKSWGEGIVRIVQSQDPNHPSTAQDNLYHIQHLLSGTDHDFKPLANDLKGTPNFDDKPMPEEPASTGVMFSGTFQEMFTDHICGTLAADSDATSTLLKNFTTAADELYVDRDSVSGVDLNDETMNMMQVQKSLTAAYRLMTVIDDMLDRLINNTGRAGL